MKHTLLATAVLGLIVCASGLFARAADSTPAKPNIGFILADDLGYMDIGANNPKTFYETPNIDALAAKVMRFKQGYAACPVCSPTRASILTGKNQRGYPGEGGEEILGGAASSAPGGTPRRRDSRNRCTDEAAYCGGHRQAAAIQDWRGRTPARMGRGLSGSRAGPPPHLTLGRV